MCIRDRTKAGPGAGVPYKMQFAINQCGAPKILWAAFRAAIDKLRGVHGTFYKIAGDEVYGLDGFFGHDIEEYAEMGIRIPADPDGVCNKVFQETGVVSMIVEMCIRDRFQPVRRAPPATARASPPHRTVPRWRR